jgi:hypothetical protein
MECHEKRFSDLIRTYEGNERVIALNRFVGFDPDNCLDKILADTPIPKNFDLLSIDVDGNDYHIWEAVEEYRPKVVVIEFNATIPPEVEFVQPYRSPRDLFLQQLADRVGELEVRAGSAASAAVQKILEPVGRAVAELDALQDPRHLYMRCVPCAAVF